MLGAHNILLGLNECNKISFSFTLNAVFQKKELGKAKSLIASPEKLLVKESWQAICLKTRENMLTYFASLDPISFRASLFPLPPAVEPYRLEAIAKLVACQRTE